MGIPLYFKTISEKYSDIIQAHIDHHQTTRLFLDLNGAIHPVCRNYLKLIEEYNPLERSQIERVMINNLLDYIQKLINFSQAESVFIAIDGVAPLAKMNQQKMRRFKSAWERGTSGENKPYWDTNMISPGTPFMSFLQEEIKKAIDTNRIHPFSKINGKIQKQILLSNSNVPGEGEHKIVAFIRDLPKDSDENIVIYGLDADLMMLSMALRRDNVFLLREEIEFKKTGTSMEEQTWGDHHLYLNVDFLKRAICEEMITRIHSQDSLAANFRRDNTTDEGRKLGNFIDDYVFLSFLFGNDFIPHSLTLDLRHNGLDALMKAYVKSYLQMGQSHLIQNNKIYSPQFRYIIELLSRTEDKRAKQIHDKRKRYKPNTAGIENEAERERFIKSIEPIRKRKDEDFILIGTDGWRERYNRVVFPILNEWERDEICNIWCKTLSWNIQYYYTGCPQQDWVYGYNHVPTFMDLHKFLQKDKSFDFSKYTFRKGTPHNPLVQLLCIMPRDSRALLPKSAHPIMLNKDSPLRYLYPSQFETDSYYKKYNWQCEPKIPQIDIEECKAIVKKLHVPTKERNRFKKEKIYSKNFS